MSFIVEYRQGRLQKCFQFTKRRVPSPLYYLKTFNTFISGDTFGITNEELALTAWKDNPDILNDIEGNVSILCSEEKTCVFATDMNGIDAFYYYHKNGRFIVSDQFWDIVKEIQPCKEDINIETIRYMLFEGGTTDGSSIIRDLKQIMPNHIITYDALNDTLTVKQYRQFRYTCTCDDINVAVARMDAILMDTMQKIKAKCGDVEYGLGISGGLDSRIISHYAKAAGMKINGFNICVPKPHGLLDAMSIKNAKRIAEAFQVPFTVVPWKDKNIIDKIRFAVKQSPDFSGNSFKYEIEGMPKFEVLLTGGSGLVVGSMLPNNLDNFRIEQLVDAIYNLFGSYSASSFYSRCKRGLNYLFGVRINAKTQKDIYWASVLVGKDYKKIILQDLENFVRLRYKQGFSNLDIFEDIFLNVCGHNNRYGAFETLFSTKRSFSIYVPFMLKETLTWTPRLLYNRLVLNKLIEEKIPEVADVGTESFHTAPNIKTNSCFSKLGVMFEFLLRGNGTSIDEYYMKNSGLISEFINYMNINLNDWFHKLFNIEGVRVNKSVVMQDPVRITVRVWELKALIDCLENKDYLNY